MKTFLRSALAIVICLLPLRLGAVPSNSKPAIKNEFTRQHLEPLLKRDSRQMLSVMPTHSLVLTRAGLAMLYVANADLLNVVNPSSYQNVIRNSLRDLNKTHTSAGIFFDPHPVIDWLESIRSQPLTASELKYFNDHPLNVGSNL